MTLAVLAAVGAALLWPAHPRAGAQAPSFTGSVAPEGISLLVTTAAVTPATLVADLEAAGCDVVTIAITQGGAFVVFVPGAPPFVNAGFPATIPAQTAFAVRCEGGAGGFTRFEASSPGTAQQALTIADVRVAEHAGFDRFVLEFAEAGLPEYRIEYVEEPQFTCGAGFPVSVAGEATLRVELRGINIHDEQGNALIPVRELMPQLPAILEVREICGFEGMAIFLLGLDERQPFRLTELADPSRLVIDIPH